MATILVVGADRGIAYRIATQLHKRGDEVIAACLGDGDDHRNDQGAQARYAQRSGIGQGQRQGLGDVQRPGMQPRAAVLVGYRSAQLLLSRASP